MAKRFVACPFCWGKIKDSAIKCMHCKKWLNTEENPNYQPPKKIEPEINENINKIETRTTKTDIEVPHSDDKSILWWIIWFQTICLLWALINIL